MTSRLVHVVLSRSTDEGQCEVDACECIVTLLRSGGHKLSAQHCCSIMRTSVMARGSYTHVDEFTGALASSVDEGGSRTN